MKHDIILTDGTRIVRGEEYVPPKIRHDKVAYAKKLKYMDIADMKLEGKSLEEIGKKYNCTRENIRQLLRRHFPEIDFPKQYKGGRLNPNIKTITKVCPSCNKTFSYRDIKRNWHPTFCNQQCRTNMFVKQNGNQIRKMTPEQFRKYNNTKQHEYYKKHHNEPWFKKYIWRYNQRASLKRQLRAGRISPKKYTVMLEKVNKSK